MPDEQTILDWNVGGFGAIDEKPALTFYKNIIDIKN